MSEATSQNRSVSTFWALGVFVCTFSFHTFSFAPFDVAELDQGIELLSDISPAKLIYYILPISHDCPGKMDTVLISVNPEKTDIFIR